MTGNVVVSQVDTLMYVLLGRAEKHVPGGGELVVTTECVTLYPRCRYNRVQFY